MGLHKKSEKCEILTKYEKCIPKTKRAKKRERKERRGEQGQKKKRKEHRTGYKVGTRSAGFEKRRAEKERAKALKALSTVGLGQSYGMYGPPRQFRRSSSLRQVPQ